MTSPTKSKHILDKLGTDSFGLFILSLVCLNRGLYAYMKMTADVRTVVTYDSGVILQSHWLESILPLPIWIWVWLAMSISCIMAIFVKTLAPTTLGIISGIFTIWGASSFFSMQNTGLLFGTLWIGLALLIVWGISRVDPEIAEKHNESVDDFLARREMNE